MRKVLFLLMTVFLTTLCACSDDVELSRELVTGKWNVTWAEQSGESVDIPSGSVYITLREDGTYTTVMFKDYYKGAWSLDGNTVVGVTTDPITERYKFTSLKGRDAEIDYSNSEGDVMRFRATKE